MLITFKQAPITRFGLAVFMLYLCYAKIYFKAFNIVKGACIVFVCVLICTPGMLCAHVISGYVGSGDGPRLHLYSFSITSELCDLGQVTCCCVCVCMCICEL